MYNIAVMGDYDSIFGFASIGLDIYPVDDAKEAEKTLRQLAENNYAVIYITEGLADKIESEIKKYQRQILPSIILIPGIKNNTGKGMLYVKKSVEQAVGSDIISDN
ncbi:MAG: V-type ATP synthase subunit F [Clostridiaceae bacterium]|nr:V-type ATP synthase subunit F [Clostridiaceae bacterium]